jgi:hypothetical protein
MNNRVAPWQDLRGQLFLGSEDFLRQMQARIEALEKGSLQLSKAVRMPNRPTTTQLINQVAETVGLPADEVFNRKLNKEAFQLLVYLLRRVRNLPLKDVAVMAGISCTRVSQIQKRFDNPDDLPILLPQTQALLKKYEV